MIDKTCKNFEKFCIKFGDVIAVDTLERICDAMWNKKYQADYGVKFSDIHQHNACNHTATGEIEIQGKKFGFIIDNGDWGGTVIREWGEPGEIGIYEPPKPTIYTFVPENDDLKTEKPHIYRVYLLWRKQGWFKEKEKGYNYDKHFQPGCKTESHYRDWAKSKGMKIAIKQDDEVKE